MAKTKSARRAGVGPTTPPKGATAPADDIYLTVEEAAVALGVTMRTIYRLITAGRLSPHKPAFGKVRARVLRSEVDRLLEVRPVVKGTD